MRILAPIPAIVLAFGLSACCGLRAPSFPHSSAKAAPAVAAAPAASPAPAAAPAPAPAPETVTIALEVKFDTAQAVVKPEYDDQLKKVSDFLKAYPDSKATIEGHTDDVGAAEYNKALSQRRADAVRQALIDRFGADGSRLSAVGYGPERPLVANDGPANRAVNRRVVAVFTGTK